MPQVVIKNLLLQRNSLYEVRFDLQLWVESFFSNSDPFMCRNKDFQEVCLEKDGETVLRFAAAFGFRNIQNMVLKLRKGKFHYHFVEVLACPGGEFFFS